MSKQQTEKKDRKPPTSRELQLLTWKVNPLEEQIKYYTVSFPEGWYKRLYGWYQRIQETAKVNLPTRSLNLALQALPISLMEVKNFYKDKLEWLKFLRPVEKSVIYEIFKAWFLIEFINHDKVTEELKNELINGIGEFKLEDLEVHEEILELTQFEELENGTTSVPSMSYAILPRYMMTYIAEEKLSIMINGKEYYFLKAAGVEGDELISYPVQGKNGNYYSIGISFKLVTVPGINRPLLNLNTQVKKWANGKYVNTISRAGNTTVFIKYNKEKQEFYEIGSTLGRDQIRYDYKKESFVWCQNTKSILEHAQMTYLPEVNEVLKASEVYLQEDKDYTLFIAYNKDNVYDHDVKSGITMPEKNEIFNEISKHFNFISPIRKTDLTRIKRTLRENVLGQGKNKEIGNYLKATSELFKEVTIEMLWLREEIPQKIKRWLRKNTQDDENVKWCEDESTFEYGELKINLVDQYSQDLTTKMENYKQRVEDVKNYVSDAKGVVMSIVEIPAKDATDYKEGGDPKAAIRRGLYKCKRVNQFINLETEVNDAIIENILRELFRQLGVCIALPSTTGLKGIPEKLDIVGFTLLSSNQIQNKVALEVPVAISVSTYDREIRVKTPFSNEWQSYYEAILELGSREYQKYDKKQKDRQLSKVQLNTFFTQILNEIKEENALVLVDVSNRMNTLLPDFQNNNLMISKTNSEYKKLRLIRVKSNPEIPDYVGVAEKVGEIEDFLSGVWGITEDIFYSIEPKALTFTTVNSSKPKLDYPRKFVKYPKMLEIIPVKLLEEDDKGDFVWFTHRLRGMNSMYEDYTKMPFVIHLGEKLKEVLEIK